jgi:tripartite-type tricarboxylate transporter receptor subunit TctC
LNKFFLAFSASWRFVVFFCLIAGPTAPSSAQSYPSRPIELVSATGAGGGSDLVCRLVADIIGKE